MILFIHDIPIRYCSWYDAYWYLTESLLGLETKSVTAKPRITNVGVDTYYSCKSENVQRVESVTQTLYDVTLQAFVTNGSKSDTGRLYENKHQAIVGSTVTKWSDLLCIMSNTITVSVLQVWSLFHFNTISIQEVNWISVYLLNWSQPCLFSEKSFSVLLTQTLYALLT